MNDADALARRYFALWAEYLTALLADPQAADMVQRWIAFTSQFAARPPGAAGERSAIPFPAWPPTPSAARPSPTRPKAAAAAAAGASGERGNAVDELARRVGELERRLAALEHKPKRSAVARRTRRGDRASGQ